MSTKAPALAVVVLGALLVFISLFADLVGIGDDPGFGRQQILGTIAGLLVMAAGAYLYLNASDRGDTE